MHLAEHEINDLHELAMSCVNSITNMACFLNQVQDSELKSILERHFPLHVQDYNMKVAWLKTPEGPGTQLPVGDLEGSPEQVMRQAGTPVPVTPRTDVQQFNDREIATAYLLTLKRAGREYAWAAMEMSHPEIRRFLEDAFRMSSRHAYEVWQWMAKKGYYPVQPASRTFQEELSRFYQPVTEPAPAGR